jgi:hypothetical protein
MKHENFAEGNIHLHTPEFRQLEMYRALGNNTKIYFGDKIPNMFLPTGLN